MLYRRYLLALILPLVLLVQGLDSQGFCITAGDLNSVIPGRAIGQLIFPDDEVPPQGAVFYQCLLNNSLESIITEDSYQPGLGSDRGYRVYAGKPFILVDFAAFDSAQPDDNFTLHIGSDIYCANISGKVPLDVAYLNETYLDMNVSLHRVSAVMATYLPTSGASINWDYNLALVDFLIFRSDDLRQGFYRLIAATEDTIYIDGSIEIGETYRYSVIPRLGNIIGLHSDDCELIVYTPTRTPTMTPSATFTHTATYSPTSTPTATHTQVPTFTATVSPTGTSTHTPTGTATQLPSATCTSTPSSTPSMLPTATLPPSAPLPSTPTATPTRTLFSLGVPEIYPEPLFTKGRSNLIGWSDESGYPLKYYEVQYDLNASFGDPLGTLTTEDTSFEFADLQVGIPYYYRVRSRFLNSRVSPWSNTVFSIQDNAPPASSVLIDLNITASRLLPIDFEACDDYAGIKVIRLFYRRRGEDTWRSYPAESSGESLLVNAVVLGGAGTYDFYSLAIDNAGNMEDVKNHPQATVRFEIPISDDFEGDLGNWEVPLPKSDYRFPQVTDEDRHSGERCLVFDEPMQAIHKVFALPQHESSYFYMRDSTSSNAFLAGIENRKGEQRMIGILPDICPHSYAVYDGIQWRCSDIDRMDEWLECRFYMMEGSDSEPILYIMIKDDQGELVNLLSDEEFGEYSRLFFISPGFSDPGCKTFLDDVNIDARPPSWIRSAGIMSCQGSAGCSATLWLNPAWDQPGMPISYDIFRGATRDTLSFYSCGDSRIFNDPRLPADDNIFYAVALEDHAPDRGGACNGGNQGLLSEITRIMIPDVMPPRIIKLSPAPGAWDVSTGERVNIWLTDDCSLIDESSIQLIVNHGSIPYSVGSYGGLYHVISAVGYPFPADANVNISFSACDTALNRNCIQLSYNIWTLPQPTPTTTATYTATSTPAATSTGTPTSTITCTPSPTTTIPGTPTAPPPTATFTPTVTPTATPRMLFPCGGHLDTAIGAGGGELSMLLLITDESLTPISDLVVEVYYASIPTGIILGFDGGAYVMGLTIPAPAASGRYLLEFVVTQGRQQLPCSFPHLQVME